MNAKELVDRYNKMIKRASEVAGCYVCEVHMARLSFNGDDAVISWPEAESGYYNSCSIETQTAKFPSYLLDATDSEVEYYKSEQRRVAKEASERLAAQRAQEQEARELQILANLKAKYGA